MIGVCGICEKEHELELLEYKDGYTGFRCAKTGKEFFSKNPVVKIGAQEFTVVRVENLRGDEGTLVDGQMNFNQSEIRIDTRLDAFSVRQTLWHEIIHGILTQSGRTDNDEGMVDTLVYGILNVLKNNDLYLLLGKIDKGDLE